MQPACWIPQGHSLEIDLCNQGTSLDPKVGLFNRVQFYIAASLLVPKDGYSVEINLYNQATLARAHSNISRILNLDFRGPSRVPQHGFSILELVEDTS